MSFRPLLSPIDDPQSNPKFFDFINYPCLTSPKFDGIRGLTATSGVMSRTWKPLPSAQVQDTFKLVGLDGEIIVGDPTAFGVYNLTQSHVMSGNKPADDINYHVFDCIHSDYIHLPYYERLEMAHSMIKGQPRFIPVEHELIGNYEQLIAYENKCLEMGYEGIMIRDPMGRYKNNRATMREGIIFKLKRFTDDEGVIVGFVQRMENHNEQTTDERGYAKRSDSKEGKVPVDMVGKFLVKWGAHVLEVAPGVFKHHELREIWHNQEAYIGRYLKFRYFAHGVKDLPRFPRALGFRDKLDM